MEQLSEGQKLHHILEYLCTEKKERRKGSCDTDEIANSFNPPLKVAEVNVLCKRLMQEGDVRDCSSKDNIHNLCVLFIRATQDAYETEKYLSNIDKIAFNFNIYYEDNKACYHIFNVDKKYVEKIIDAYANGSTFRINGIKYSFEKLEVLKIFTYENEVDERSFIDECVSRNLVWQELYSSVIALTPEAFKLIGKEVTDNFIGDIEYGGQTTMRIDNEFVSPSRIKELNQITSDKFDLTRLIQLCKEINDNYRLENYLSVGMIGRTILHHIPPIFDCKGFNEVANNYAKGSFKKNMLHLENTINICDLYLHQQIRNIETIPTKQQVYFIQDLDVLLEDIVRVLRKK